MPTSEIVRLTSDTKNSAVELLIRAFHNDPMYLHIFPDSDERSHSLCLLWDALLSYSLRFGEAYTTPGVDGVVCWLTPGNTSIGFLRALRTGFGIQQAVIRFNSDSRKRFLPIVNHADKTHNSIMTNRHWYLWLLGVEPESQGQGIGGSLIKPVLDKADAENIPVYLETETAENVVFYEKRGFEVVREDSIAEGNVTLWAMLRKPHG